MNLQYLTYPRYKETEQGTTTEKLQFLFKSYFVCFGFTFLSFLLMKLVDFLIVNYMTLPSIEALIHQNAPILRKEYGSYYFLVAVVIVPFLEEVVFRLPLDISKKSIAIALSVMVYTHSGSSILRIDIFSYHTWLSIILALSVFILTINFLSNDFLVKVKTLYFKHFFYLMAILFALVHIANFAISDYRLFLLYPIYVLPQFFMGIFIGNIRMQYGFFWGLLLHALINLPSVFS
jgi:Type II CAAX prenyl endopeptidase Rce1-like